MISGKLNLAGAVRASSGFVARSDRPSALRDRHRHSLWPPAVQAGQAGPDALWSGVRQNADIVTEKVCPGEKFSCSTESHRKFFPGHKRKRWKRGFSFLQILKQNIDESRVLWYSRRANGRARSFFMLKSMRRSLKKFEFKWRWKSCAQESHWHVQNANSVTTT